MEQGRDGMSRGVGFFVLGRWRNWYTLAVQDDARMKYLIPSWHLPHECFFGFESRSTYLFAVLRCDAGSLVWAGLPVSFFRLDMTAIPINMKKATPAGIASGHWPKLREPDLNRRPRGYEPRDVLGCGILIIVKTRVLTALCSLISDVGLVWFQRSIRSGSPGGLSVSGKEDTYREAPMTIFELIDGYCSKRDLSKNYKHQLICFASVVSSQAGSKDAKKVLRPESVNPLISRESGYADETRSNFRRRYLCLARYAKQQGVIKSIGKKKLFEVRKRASQPNGYTPEDASKVVQVVAPNPPEWLQRADRDWLSKPMQGTGIVRRAWWLAYLLACWDSGHPTDIRDLSRADLVKDVIYRPRGKTATSGRVIFCRLNPLTMHAIKAMQWNGDQIFPNWGEGNNWNCLWKDYRRICSLARVGGSLKWFRSGAGTDYEKNNPGQGHVLLANSRVVFERNYLVKPHLGNAPQSRALNV